MHTTLYTNLQIVILKPLANDNSSIMLKYTWGKGSTPSLLECTIGAQMFHRIELENAKLNLN